MHLDSHLGGAAFTPQGPFSSTLRIDDPSHGGTTDSMNPEQLTARLSATSAENRELRAELEQARAEKARMAEILSRLAELLGSSSPDRLVHDLRNVLNERELYRALADSVM